MIGKEIGALDQPREASAEMSRTTAANALAVSNPGMVSLGVILKRQPKNLLEMLHAVQHDGQEDEYAHSSLSPRTSETPYLCVS
jgi:hypothetical protein